MTDTNETQNPTQQANRSSASRLIRERIHASRTPPEDEGGAQTGSTPDSPPEGRTPEAAPKSQAAQEPQRNARPEPQTPDDLPDSFTGQETDEQLKEMGYNKPATWERFRRLARERNRAGQEFAQERAKNQQLEQQLQELQAQVQASQGDLNKVSEDVWEFQEEFPEDGSRAEQERWRIRKEAWDVGTKQAKKVAEMLVDQIAPLRSHMSRQLVDQEWREMQSVLEQNGTSREELEPTVLAMWKQDPSRHFRGVVYDAMAQTGVLDGEPYVPETQTPGRGRQSQPREQPPATEADERRAAFQGVKQAAESGNPAQKRRALANVIGRTIQRPD